MSEENFRCLVIGWLIALTMIFVSMWLFRVRIFNSVAQESLDSAMTRITSRYVCQ